MHKNDAIELALTGRVSLYGAFHAVFGGEPTPELLQMLAGEEFAQMAGTFVGEGAAALEALRTAAGEALGAHGGAEAAAGRLVDAYNRLFVGPAAPEAAPWETVYVGSAAERALFGCVTLEARRAYVEQGLIPQGYPNVSDDHVAIELDFMRLLGERAREAYGAGDAGAAFAALGASAGFLRDHVLLWAGGFAEALARAPHGALYSEAAAVLAAFAAADAQLVAELQAALEA